MYEWGDANGDGLANGFTKDADITATFATNIQSLELLLEQVVITMASLLTYISI